MPTGARLVSAIYFAGLAYVLGFLVHAALEADIGYEVQVGRMKEVLAVIGILVGWKVMGSRAGEGRSYAVQGGILAAVSIVFWALIIFSLREMIKESTKLKYDDAPEAVVDAFRIAIDHVVTLANVPIVALLLVGGIFGGYLAEFISHRWR